MSYFPEKLEECGILGKTGAVEIWRRFIEFGGKKSSRDPKYSKEPINDDEIFTEPELIRMNKKKLNSRKKQHFSKTENYRDEQQLACNSNQRIIPNYVNHFNPRKNQQCEVYKPDINGNLSNHCNNLSETYQSTEVTRWSHTDQEDINVPRIISNFAYLPNHFPPSQNFSSSIFLNGQMNLKGRHEIYENDFPLKFIKIGNDKQFGFERGLNDEAILQFTQNHAVQLVMENIEANCMNRDNFMQSFKLRETQERGNRGLDGNSYGHCPMSCVNQEPSIFTKIVRNISHNVQMEDSPVWDKRVVGISDNDFYDYSQARPILNRFS